MKTLGMLSLFCYGNPVVSCLHTIHDIMPLDVISAVHGGPAVVIYHDRVECAVSPVDYKLIVHIVSPVKFSEIQHRAKITASHLKTIEMRHICPCRHILLQLVCLTLECGCDVLPVKPSIIEKIISHDILHQYLQGDRHSISIYSDALTGGHC